jgi:UDP-glucose 4-epimerase
VRDYIHVLDLCQAHLLALETLLEGGRTNSYNVGIGRGYSVLELIAAVQEVTGKHISIKQDQRRPGDPPILVADASLLREQLGWSPVFSDLHLMVQHAWQWEQKRQKVLGPVDISTIA